MTEAEHLGVIAIADTPSPQDQEPVDRDDEMYEIGVREGYERAVQEIDILTGGDGEYRYCTDHDPERHTPDAATMIRRIVDRFEMLNLLDAAIEDDPTLGFPAAAPQPTHGTSATDPTDAMIAAALNVDWGVDIPDADVVREIWKAMRAAAPNGASATDPAPSVNVRCPCTTCEQSEECPVGFPSLLCTACNGKGDAPIDKVVALAAEMMKVAEQSGELEDPFAAWETIDLIKSQHGQLRKAVKELKFALFSSDMTIKDRADQAARLILAATASEGSTQ